MLVMDVTLCMIMPVPVVTMLIAAMRCSLSNLTHTGKRNNSLYWRWLVNLVLPKYRIFIAHCDVAAWDLLSPYDDVLIVLSHCVTHQTGVGWGRDR